jgi:hypothetical protein
MELKLKSRVDEEGNLHLQVPRIYGEIRAYLETKGTPIGAYDLQIIDKLCFREGEKIKSF